MLWLRPRVVREERAALAARMAEARRAIRALPRESRRLLAAEARDLTILRERIVEQIGAASCCATCASRLPGADPAWPGGHCCSGGTAFVTPPVELAVLALDGRRLDRRAPAASHHGCIFCGRSGCVLRAADRPSICVRYLCHDLVVELHRRGVLREVLPLTDRLEAGVRRVEEALATASNCT